MSKVYQLKSEQLLNLRNNLIISEALENSSQETTAAGVTMARNAENYNDFSLNKINKEEPADVSQGEKDESVIFGDVAKGLYNYAQSYKLPDAIATQIEAENPSISIPTAKIFIEQLLYGIYRMASDPAQNVAFDRFLRSIGVTLNANLLSKDNSAAGEKKIQ